jgi:class I fructose-bisphosphate aldolase
MLGTTLRTRRLSRQERYLLVPLDHGVSVGPLPGLRDPAALIRNVTNGGATGVIVHKGLVRSFAASEAQAGLLVHLSSSTVRAPDVDEKRLVTTVKEAAQLGGDAVSVHVNLGSRTESRQLEDFGRIVSEARDYGLPVLCMIYPRGPQIKNPFEPELVAHAARLAEELGADIVKTVYTGDPSTFRDVTTSVSVPVLVAGGPKADSETACLDIAHGAMRGGARGVSIGRNVFQAPDPQSMTAALARIVFDGSSVEDARGLLRGALA